VCIIVRFYGSFVDAVYGPLSLRVPSDEGTPDGQSTLHVESFSMVEDTQQSNKLLALRRMNKSTLYDTAMVL
jgi:hypothetical protein